MVILADLIRGGQDGTVCRFRRVVRAARNGHCAEKLVLVNTMIRLPNVIFAGGSVGKAPRESRSGLHVQEDDMHNLIMGCI